ncbi:MAG: type III glutamate--ammonia ligase, partial [Rhodospirillaceae bacterium]|nr:type III glutamate--ammonia ligase [Rhodospirillaceae bacterium]
HPDMFAVPDPSSLIQLPWKPEVGWLAGNLMMSNKEVDHGPRNALRRMTALAESKGYYMKTGVECEYHLINADGTDISDARDTMDKPCYDQQALMRRYDVISEICDAMLELGWGPYQNDHEDANGQFEMNWDFDDVLLTADRHMFFKFMVKSIAEKHGLRATFMPKPFSHLTGNGCHTHVSLWDKTGKKNLFHDPKGELGISKMAYNFLGGVLEHSEALTAIFNPTVNSYKRINGSTTTSGATWAPNTISYTGNNRTHMVRIPDEGRFEFRLMDGATNPYLAQAALLAAGLEGIANKTDPGKRMDNNMYEVRRNADLKKLNVKRLPLNLMDAVRVTEKNKMLRSYLGDETMNAFLRMQAREWNDYARHLTQWERDHTLDC